MVLPKLISSSYLSLIRFYGFAVTTTFWNGFLLLTSVTTHVKEQSLECVPGSISVLATKNKKQLIMSRTFIKECFPDKGNQNNILTIHR